MVVKSNPRAWPIRLVWGMLAVAVYIGAVIGSARWMPVRLLYDGEAPLPPYRWVRPPSNIPGPHDPAQEGSGTISMSPLGSEPASIPTGDGQVFVSFPRDAIPPRPGETAVNIRIIPLDPQAIPPAPQGFQFDGNGYTIGAVYARSGQPAVARGLITVILRFPIHATHVLRLADAQWAVLITNKVDATQQLFGMTDRLGTFIAAAAPGSR